MLMPSKLSAATRSQPTSDEGIEKDIWEKMDITRGGERLAHDSEQCKMTAKRGVCPKGICHPQTNQHGCRKVKKENLKIRNTYECERLFCHKQWLCFAKAPFKLRRANKREQWR